MKHIQLLNRSSTLALVLAGLTLAACNRAAPPADVQQAPPPTAALALTTDPNAPPLVDAPPVNALPPAPRARIGRLQRPSDGYAFVDRGYAMSHAFSDAPPDYTFDYGGVRPWVWRADDQSEQVVEPVEGGNRYYYYRPGDDQPFLIRDPNYSYGYEGGELVVIYDRNGRPLPDQYVEQHADLAGRYLARALAIYAAAQSQQRQAVAAANWRARRTYLDNEQNQWAAEQNQDDAWRAYHAEHDQDEQAEWDAERYRRQAEAARYAAQANDAQAAARFAEAAALALQLSQNHRQGPPNAPQGGPGFGPQPQAPTQQFGPSQGQARTGSVAPNPSVPVPPPIDRGAADQARAAQQASAQQQARAQMQQQAAAQQQGRALAQQQAAQQQAAQRQHSLDTATQARIAQQAAAQQQARTQMEQRSAQQQQALDAQARARVAQQAAGQQQARAQMQQQAAQQQAAQRQQALEAARAQGAQQAAAQQQARAQAVQQAAAQQQARARAAQVAAQRQAQVQQHAQAAKVPPAPAPAKPKAAAPIDKSGKAGEPDRSHQKQPD